MPTQIDLTTTEDLRDMELRLVRRLEQSERRLCELIRDRKASELGFDRRPYLSPKEFARLVGVEKSTVCRWCRLGVVRATQMGSRGGIWMILREEVDRMIEQTKSLEPNPPHTR